MKKEAKKRYLPDDEVSLFCEQATLILKSGVPIVEGMEALFEEDGEGELSTSYQKLLSTLKGHDQLSDGLTAAEVFPPYMIKLVKIGEISGKLETAMNALAAYYRRESDVKKALKSAVIYPLLLILVLAAVIVIMVTQVMPIFNRVFASLGAEMDASMHGVVQMGTTLGVMVMVLIGLVIVCVLAFAAMFKLKGGEYGKDVLGRVIRPIGRVFETISKARFASAMSLMQAAGLPTDQALALAQELPFDAKTKQKIDGCAVDMAQNDMDAPKAMAKAKLFDAIYLKMIKAGYQAGQLDETMEKVANIYEEKTDEGIRGMVGMIEPTLVAILAVAIGGILLSVMLPLAGIMTSIL